MSKKKETELERLKNLYEQLDNLATEDLIWLNAKIKKMINRRQLLSDVDDKGSLPFEI